MVLSSRLTATAVSKRPVRLSETLQKNVSQVVQHPKNPSDLQLVTNSQTLLPTRPPQLPH